MNRHSGARRLLALVAMLCMIPVSANEQQPVPDKPGALVSLCGQTSTASYAAYINPGWADNSPASVIFASDSQYPRVKLEDGSEGSDRGISQRKLREVFTSISRLRGESTYTPVFINGDLTDFGHGEERRDVQSLFPVMNGAVGGPLFFPGLGNHDYENNVEDCANNGCARDSICDVSRWVNEFHPSALAPKFSDSKGSEDRLRGSLSYSVTVGQVHFIQLNNYITYRKTFKSLVEGFWGEATYRIDSSLRWLAGDLREARKKGLIIIMNLHNRDGSMDTAADAKIRQLVESYGVSAVFVGHYHDQLGYYPTARFGGVPVFQSGALFKDQSLKVGFNYQNMTANVEAWTGDGLQQIRTFPLKAGASLPSLVNDFSDSEIVFYEGNGGNQKVVCDVPIGTNNIRFSMKQYGCSNDEARSLIIMKAKQHTFISVYGNYDQNGNQGYATIEVKQDILLPEVVGSFDRTVEHPNWKIIKYGPEGLDGKISSAWVRPYNSTTNGYATFMEHTNVSGNVVCTEMLSPDRNWNLGGGCANDEISSVILHQVRSGMNVCLFGNYHMKEDQGFTCISAKTNLNQLVIPTLYMNLNASNYRVYHYGGRINGKVSSIKIDYIPMKNSAADSTPVEPEVDGF